MGRLKRALKALDKLLMPVAEQGHRGSHSKPTDHHDWNDPNWDPSVDAANIYGSQDSPFDHSSPFDNDMDHH